jgi:hypothetical protein
VANVISWICMRKPSAIHESMRPYPIARPQGYTGSISQRVCTLRPSFHLAGMPMSFDVIKRLFLPTAYTGGRIIGVLAYHRMWLSYVRYLSVYLSGCMRSGQMTGRLGEVMRGRFRRYGRCRTSSETDPDRKSSSW